MHVRFNEEIIVICGPMYSGKSHSIMFHLEKLRFAKIPYVVFKANIDRFSDEIGSRYKDTKEKAISIDIKNPKDIFKHVDPKNVKLPFTVIIDEAQFYSDEIYDVVKELAKAGISVIISGLDLDGKMQPFGPMPKLMALATQVIKTTSACTRCQNIATKTAAAIQKEEVIRVGEEDQFFPVCTQCWHKHNEGSN